MKTKHLKLTILALVLGAPLLAGCTSTAVHAGQEGDNERVENRFNRRDDVRDDREDRRAVPN